jgi:hypothetical protein
VVPIRRIVSLPLPLAPVLPLLLPPQPPQMAASNASTVSMVRGRSMWGRLLAD